MRATVNTQQIQALIPKLQKFRGMVVPIVGGILTKQVKELSQEQQKDFTGAAFAPLTKGYAKRKARSGRQPIPNLTYTGKFMNRIGLRQDNPVMPYVGPIDAFQPQAHGLDKKRKIWGVHPDSIRNVETKLKEAFTNVVLH